MPAWITDNFPPRRSFLNFFYLFFSLNRYHSPPFTACYSWRRRARYIDQRYALARFPPFLVLFPLFSPLARTTPPPPPSPTVLLEPLHLAPSKPHNALRTIGHSLRSLLTFDFQQPLPVVVSSRTFTSPLSRRHTRRRVKFLSVSYCLLPRYAQVYKPKDFTITSPLKIARLCNYILYICLSDVDIQSHGSCSTTNIRYRGVFHIFK